jgi:hypothetical protein
LRQLVAGCLAFQIQFDGNGVAKIGPDVMFRVCSFEIIR